MPPEGSDLLLLTDIPELHGLTVTAGSQDPAVRRECHAPKRASVPLQVSDLPPGAEIPQLQLARDGRGVVQPARRGQQVTVRRERHRMDPEPVTGQNISVRLPGDIPQLDRLVVAGRGEGLAVRRER